MRTYAILCHARTGSNYLLSILAQHPEITAHNELFHERTIYHANGEINDPQIIAQRNSNPVAYLQAVLNECKTPIFGFKHLLFYDETIIEYVMKNNFHLILLERKNVLAQYSSLMIAHQTGQWTVHNGDKALEASKLNWNEASFEKYRQEYISAYEKLHQQIEAHQVPYLHLYYADLFKTETLASILSFLGAKQEFTFNLKAILKQNTSRIIERFIQSELVRDYLAKIQHPEWIEEAVQDG